MEQVVAGRSDEDLQIGQAVRKGTGRCRDNACFKIKRDPVRERCITQCILACTAINRVISSATDHQITSGTTANDVVIRAAFKGIRSGTAIQFIITSPGNDCVIPGTAENAVCCCGTGDRIVMIAGDEDFNTAEAVCSKAGHGTCIVT